MCDTYVRYPIYPWSFGMSHIYISHIIVACKCIRNANFPNTFSQLESLIGAGLTSNQIFVLQVYLPQVGTSDEDIIVIRANSPFLFG